jgi:hypothetical protein
MILEFSKYKKSSIKVGDYIYIKVNQESKQHYGPDSDIFNVEEQIGEVVEVKRVNDYDTVYRIIINGEKYGVFSDEIAYFGDKEDCIIYKKSKKYNL